MAWTDLLPSKRVKHPAAAGPVQVGCNDANGRFAQWLELSFRLDDVAVPWLVPGAKVNVALGSGEHVGMISVTSGQRFRLVKAFRTVRVRVPALASQKKTKHRKAPVQFNVEGNAIVITLPDWAVSEATPRPTTPATQQKPAGPAAKGGAPFKIGAPSHADVLKSRGAR